MDEELNQRQYWDGRLREHWGPEGVGSVVYGRRFNQWRYRVRRVAFRRLVQELGLDLPGLNVLDVGCGTGFYLEQWRALGVSKLAGLDIADSAIRRLAPAFPEAAFYRCDVSATPSPLPADSFDVASAIDVLPHLVDDARYATALRSLHRALREDGLLICSDAFLHGSDKRYENYWKGRSLANVETAMRGCGFRVLGRRPMSVLMAAPNDTRRPERNESIWNSLTLPVRRSEVAGFVAGALLYPIELSLVLLLDESPAIEFMICQKVSHPAE